MTRFTRWAGHAVKATGWNLSARAALSGLALVGGLALLAAFYLALSSQTAVLGRHLQDLQSMQVETLQENADLRDQIARASSAINLMHRALAAGFVPTGTVLFMPVAPDQSRGFALSQTPP